VEKLIEYARKFLTDSDLLTVGLLILIVKILLKNEADARDLLTYGVLAWYVLKKAFASISKQAEENAMETKILKAIQDGVGAINANTNARVDKNTDQLSALNREMGELSTKLTGLEKQVDRIDDKLPDLTKT